MKTTIRSLYPVIITDNLQACKKFYHEYFSFEIVYESDWYIQLITDSGVELGFMKDSIKSQPIFLRKKHSGEGVILTFEVENCKKEYERLKLLGLSIVLDYTEEEWGQKHFMVQDPVGTYLDIVELTKPEYYT